MGDTLDFTSIQRQFDDLYQRGMGCIRKSRANNKVDEKLLRQGEIYMDQARQIIENGMVEVLKSVNPAEVAQSLSAAAAAGLVSKEFAQLASSAITRAAAQVGTQALAGAGNVALRAALGEVLMAAGISIGIIATGFAIYGIYLGYKALRDKLSRESSYVAAVYLESTAKIEKHRPFQVYMRPGTV